jgi:hypothetical protein
MQRSLPFQRQPESLIAELAQQPVDVPQVPEPARHVAIGNQMGRGVDDHVRRGEHPQPVRQ